MTGLRASVAGVVAALLVVLTTLLAGPASAHSTLVSSDPANGSSVASGPSSVTLTFNEALQDAYDALTVVGPDNRYWQSDEKARVEGPRITVGLRPLGPAGEYRINYRVTSADGHPVSGQVRFTLTTAGTGTPGAEATASSSDSGGVTWWPYAVGVVVVVALGGGAFLLRRRTAGV
ncbi:MAG: copper resistance protein CopC [Williamsia herbipolensis]|nr:copper resistance protein CopC [Williamsia herbipolensis]